MQESPESASTAATETDHREALCCDAAGERPPEVRTVWFHRAGTHNRSSESRPAGFPVLEHIVRLVGFISISPTLGQ